MTKGEMVYELRKIAQKLYYTYGNWTEAKKIHEIANEIEKTGIK